MPIKSAKTVKGKTKILLIGDQNSFMVISIKNELSSQFDILSINASVDEFRKVIDEIPRIILYYAGTTERGNVARAILEIMNEDRLDYILFLAGDWESIDVIKRTIPEDKIAGEFKRPINVRELADKMEAVSVQKELRKDKKKILVVDDDPVMLRAIKEWLSAYYRVFVVNSAMNVIEFLAKNTVDLILMDYAMPVADGPQLLKMIRSEKETQDIPVMFLTSKSDRESIHTAAELKPEAYLLKTMSKEDILNNIAEFFRRQEKKRRSDDLL